MNPFSTPQSKYDKDTKVPNYRKTMVSLYTKNLDTNKILPKTGHLISKHGYPSF